MDDPSIGQYSTRAGMVRICVYHLGYLPEKSTDTYTDSAKCFYLIRVNMKTGNDPGQWV